MLFFIISFLSQVFLGSQDLSKHVLNEMLHNASLSTILNTMFGIWELLWFCSGYNVHSSLTDNCTHYKICIYFSSSNCSYVTLVLFKVNGKQICPEPLNSKSMNGTSYNLHIRSQYNVFSVSEHSKGKCQGKGVREQIEESCMR